MPSSTAPCRRSCRTTRGVYIACNPPSKRRVISAYRRKHSAHGFLYRTCRCVACAEHSRACCGTNQAWIAHGRSYLLPITTFALGCPSTERSSFGAPSLICAPRHTRPSVRKAPLRKPRTQPAARWAACNQSSDAQAQGALPYTRGSCGARPRAPCPRSARRAPPGRGRPARAPRAGWRARSRSPAGGPPSRRCAAAPPRWRPPAARAPCVRVRSGTV